VNHLHEKRIAHRNLNPSKIMFAETFDYDNVPATLTAVIIGFSSVYDEKKGIKNMEPHTEPRYSDPIYSKPEEIKNSPDAPFKADAYVLGLLMVKMATNARRMQGMDDAKLLKIFNARTPNFSKAFKDLVELLLTKRPAMETVMAHEWLKAPLGGGKTIEKPKTGKAPTTKGKGKETNKGKGQKTK